MHWTTWEALNVQKKFQYKISIFSINTLKWPNICFRKVELYRTLGYRMNLVFNFIKQVFCCGYIIHDWFSLLIIADEDINFQSKNNIFKQTREVPTSSIPTRLYEFWADLLGFARILFWPIRFVNIMTSWCVLHIVRVVFWRLALSQGT